MAMMEEYWSDVLIYSVEFIAQPDSKRCIYNISITISIWEHRIFTLGISDLMVILGSAATVTLPMKSAARSEPSLLP